jgi:transposase-like protein
VLDCWLSATRDLPAAEAFFGRSITSTGCVPEHVVTDKAPFSSVSYPQVRTRRQAHLHRLPQPGDLDNRCERNHGYLKSRLGPMRGLKSVDCVKYLFPALDAMQLIERGFVAGSCTGLPRVGGRSYMRARNIADVVAQLGQGV